MTQNGLTADEISLIREAIIQELQDDCDASVAVIEFDLVTYEVNFTTERNYNTNEERFETDVKCYSGSREMFDPETGKSFDYYRFSKTELNGLNFDC
jgi:hypothetical protein